ncbi:MAG: hypothetical protein K0R57_2824 [Paenibacillaceae bacterium]|jgi:hypothetical protein|nr:hypothetical protein [Paenibacillaceae bacterium]
MDTVKETTRLLGQLLEATPQEIDQLTALLRQHGSATFWECLEKWDLPTKLLSKLQAVREVLRLMEPLPSERSSSHGTNLTQ